MNKKNAVVIGLGQIGMGYDYYRNDSDLILTHSTGFYYHENFNLIGGVDPDLEKRTQFKKKFRKDAYVSIDEFSKFHDPEVVSISVPTHLHYKVFCSVVSLLKPQVLICEKPIADNLENAKKMLEIAEELNILLVINYIRRFDPGVHKLKELISKNEFGSIFKGVVWYSKGLLNNASHFIDLIIFLFGKIENYRVIFNERKWENFDPEPDFVLEVNNAKIFFLTGKEECYTIAEMALLGTKGRVHYLNGGERILYSKTVDDLNFPNYTILSKNEIVIENDLHKSFWHTLEEINNYLDGQNNKISCTKEDAYETLKSTLNIFNEAVNINN